MTSKRAALLFLFPSHDGTPTDDNKKTRTHDSAGHTTPDCQDSGPKFVYHLPSSFLC